MGFDPQWLLHAAQARRQAEQMESRAADLADDGEGGNPRLVLIGKAKERDEKLANLYPTQMDLFTLGGTNGETDKAA
jgi:hypothetical protein